jgi:drug/metabolite transporter (DMT)-like permease
MSSARRAGFPTRYEFALLYCAAIWGSTFYIVKDVVGELHPLTLIGWRFTLAGLLLLPLVWVRRGTSRPCVPPAALLRVRAGTGTRPSKEIFGLVCFSA